MQQGDIQVYDRPEKSLWKNPVLYIVVMMSLVLGIGAYTMLSHG